MNQHVEMVYVMAQKHVCHVILTVASVIQNQPVAMEHVMGLKTVRLVRKIAGLVVHMEYFVGMEHAMAQKTVRLVLKIAALVIQHIAEMEHVMAMKPNGLVLKIAGLLITVGMAIVCINLVKTV